MSLKSELKHFFTPKKWKTIFRGDGSAERLRFGIPINRLFLYDFYQCVFKLNIQYPLLIN